MEWRCAWCGKPHEENDPPCDNCGHGEFEKAVVPMAPESEDDDGETITVWVCTECGNDHPKHTPPCDRCGGGPLERREVAYDEEAVMAEMLGGDGDSGTVPSADVSYLDVLDTKLVFGFVAVGALVVILALGFLGVVDVPGIPGPAGPVPGNASTVDGLSLSTVEEEYVAELNARRAANGYANLSRDEGLSSAATWFNQERVRRDYGDGSGPGGEELRRRVGDACGDAELSPVVFNTSSLVGQGEDGFDSESAMARALVSAYRDSPNAPETFANVSNGLVGVDVHVGPDGEIYVTQFAC